MIRFRFTTLGFLVSLLCAAPAVSQELKVRAQIDRDVAILFDQADFAGLEHMASGFRESDERTSSGLQKLNLFYFALGDAIKYSLRSSVSWKTLAARFDDWGSAYPESKAAAIGKAIGYSEIAWHIRGGGYASTVKQSSWQPFYEWLAKADAQLRDTKGLASGDAYWYTLSAHLLNQSGAETPELLRLVEEGLDRHPGSYQLYFAAIEHLAPKWHGNADEIEKFANNAVARTREIEGNGMYARIYWYAAQTQYGLGLFAESDVIWSEMRLGIFDVLNRYPDQWNVQNFALFACLAEDQEMTRDLISQMDGEPIMRAWKSYEIFDHCRQFAKRH